MNKKLHILFLCGWYPSRVLPTNGNFIHRHAKAAALQHQVTCIHIITDPKATAPIEIVTQEDSGVLSHIAYLKKANNYVQKVWLFWKAFRLLVQKVSTFDVVHVHQIFPFGLFALYLKWFQKKRFIISEHWTDYKYPLSKNISFFHKYAAKHIVKHSHFICPVTQDLQQSLQKFGVQGSYAVVPNVVDTELFFPKHEIAKTFRIVHVSNMDDTHKNVSGILKALANIQPKMNNFEAVFIGPQATKYQEQAKSLDISTVRFIEYLPHQQLRTYLQEASVFVLFSNYENLPCVILEAFSCGIPVISSNVGGIHEFFPENFGRLIAAQNQKSLEDEILNFYFQKHTLAPKEDMHNYVVSLFSEKEICNQFTQLYYSTIQ